MFIYTAKDILLGVQCILCFTLASIFVVAFLVNRWRSRGRKS